MWKCFDVLTVGIYAGGTGVFCTYWRSALHLLTLAMMCRHEVLLEPHQAYLPILAFEQRWDVQWSAHGQRRQAVETLLSLRPRFAEPTYSRFFVALN